MLKTIDVDKDILKAFQTNFPNDVIKQKPGKGNKSFISWNTIADVLNKATNGCWNWEIVEHWMDPVYSFPSDDNSAGILITGYSANIHGRLTVFFEDENGKSRIIVKDAVGSHKLTNGEQQKDALKSASSDALKKACVLLGIGLQLYRDSSEQEYYNEINYQNVWEDEELFSQYKEQWDFINKAIKDYSLSTESMDGIVTNWNSSYRTVTQIPPEELDSFVSHVKMMMGDEEGEV